ncbi:MAG: hypothetical protein H8D26_09560 [Methanomicrobia archaeon]|nr:hypothetical protein [Methanomicrobia archaeon]
MEKIGTKKCYRCKEVKDIAEFNRNRARSDGLGTLCKSCSNEVEKERRKKYPERYRKRDKRFREERPFYIWAQASLRKHREKGIKIEMNIKELEEMVINIDRCPLCGCKLKRSNGKGPERNSPTLDRVNNESEVRKDNIMIICHQCNKTKGERTLKEFIDYCKHIASLGDIAMRPSIDQSIADRDVMEGSTDTP